jgi:hypothetical protein
MAAVPCLVHHRQMTKQALRRIRSAAARRLAVILCASMLMVTFQSRALPADQGPHRFDGEWDTALSCPNSNGALGYSFKFVSMIKDGVLHGEKGAKGEAGWLQVDGPISADGASDLYVQGLVGAARYAVGQRPAGTAYGYHLVVGFSDASGKGHRVEGRPCDVVFNKKTS